LGLLNNAGGGTARWIIGIFSDAIFRGVGQDGANWGIFLRTTDNTPEAQVTPIFFRV
jgi:hypothetical protein